MQPEDWSEEKNKIALAISDGINLLFKHCFFIISASASGVSHFSICLSVIVQPGTTEFTLILNSPRSLAKDLVNPTTADFAAV